MNNFEYIKAQTAESACAAADRDTRFHGGGIDLLGEMKDYIDSPKRVIDVSGLDRSISDEGAHWKLGGAVRLVDIENHAGLKQSIPGLVQAAEHVGSPQIRNLATIGGNLAQHSRCWYYRHPDVKCLKNGGSQCYARSGINKFHSIFAEGACISPVVSNLGVALSALDATVQVMRKGQVRELTMEAFYEDADLNPRAHNSLKPDELVVSVTVPKQRTCSSYVQISEKETFDWALVSCAVAANLENNVLSHVRLYFGVVSPVPYTHARAVKQLEGMRLTQSGVEEVAAALLEGAQTSEHNRYKVPLAKTMAKRAIIALGGQS
ncbi:Putative xanthine dehydrogenase YagS FAD-binding subunit [Pontiella desulfatans]|uniref:Xanthine dehydrogenase YagS FAD-binding subunit n=1 Tax=Pontiella desulfatans TaxID=2750659 RepID=A0A6C2UDS9_PONDE|nr:FAD binding domain-containing protein [Pontiella desulfatans]VGO17366.1 Putative xanthine dehydrogenase YagS FAD-binding subunit [Pontiella desulfatans]